jgi:hypothetical protein
MLASALREPGVGMRNVRPTRVWRRFLRWQDFCSWIWVIVTRSSGSKGVLMTAFLVLTENEPRVVAARRDAVSSDRWFASLSRTGVDKFIAYELDVETLREAYGVRFDVIEADISKGKDVRVLDSDGRHVFSNVRFTELGDRVVHGL